MTTPAEIGARNWEKDGIGPALAYWKQAYAYQRAIYEEIQKPAPDKLKLNQLVTGLSTALTGLRDAIHTLEMIGIEAKRDRTSTNG